MNYITHLTGFFDRAGKDYRLNSTHISLYMAIFQMWNVNRFKNPISSVSERKPWSCPKSVLKQLITSA